MNNIIRKNDLIDIYNQGVVAANGEKTFAVGNYAMYDSNDWPKLIYLYDVACDEDGKQFGFKYHSVDYNTLEKSDDEENIDFRTLKEYYTAIALPIEKIKDCAERLLKGESFEDFGNEAEQSAALVDTRSKETLLYLKKETEKAIIVANQVQKYAKHIIQIQKSQLEKIVSGFNDKICAMRSEVARYEYVITTIELYAGIKEDVIQLQSGEPAPIDSPLVLHQAVMFMDEEFALIDDDFDYTKEGHFNEWLIKDGNYKQLLPEERCIVAAKPRRKDKEYTNDHFFNFIFNQPNHRTVFLIRNGENLYKLESDNINLRDRLFPNRNELAEILKEEEKDEWRSFKDKDSSRSAVFRKLYTMVLFLMQGLIDRSDTLSPHNIKAKLLDDLDIDNSSGVVLRYELDRALGDGHQSYNDWIASLNGKLTAGKRIILVNYMFDKERDFLKYYRSEWTMPPYPKNGVYVLEDNPIYDESIVYYRRPRHIIKYLPDDEFWRYTDDKRTNRVSIMIDITRGGILNYDDVRLEDIDYYLNSRFYRSQYYEFVRVLKMARKLYMQEKFYEDEFIKMMVGILKTECQRTPKPEYTYEQIVKLAIDGFKDSLKWKRSITDKSKETFYILRRKIFSKAFQDKYFN